MDWGINVLTCLNNTFSSTPLSIVQRCGIALGERKRMTLSKRCDYSKPKIQYRWLRRELAKLLRWTSSMVRLVEGWGRERVSRRDAEGAQEEPLVCTLPYICFTANCATTVRRTKTATYQWSHLQLPNKGTSLLDYRTGRRDYYASLHRASGRCAANART
jgi:hypothetical protein